MLKPQEQIEKDIEIKEEQDNGPLYMEDVDCFNLISLDENGNLIAFEATNKDLYVPSQTGVFNVVAKPFDEKN